MLMSWPLSKFPAISQAKMLLLLLAVITIVSTAPVSKWIDLSYTVDENVMRYPLHRPFNHTPAIYIKDKAFFAKSFDISTAEHVATHIDAPNHLTNTEEEARNSKSIDQIPLDGLIGDAIVVNISAKAAINPDAELTVEDLQEWEKQYGQIPDGAIMLMNSGWGKYWGNKEKFTGTKTENSSLLHYPVRKPLKMRYSFGVDHQHLLMSCYRNQDSIKEASFSSFIAQPRPNCTMKDALFPFLFLVILPNAINTEKRSVFDELDALIRKSPDYPNSDSILERDPQKTENERQDLPLFGYCRDGKTPAEGPKEKGCPRKLCYDRYVSSCEKLMNENEKYYKQICRADYEKYLEECPYTCGFCPLKALAPHITCEIDGKKPKYGCCFDGLPALKPDKSDCQPCRDIYPHSCSQFFASYGGIKCESNSYGIRTFLQTKCAKTCGYCPELEESKNVK
ncbi:predicted protein [Nematostella vectensis]|uniref:ShKT domain-containing protein n=1 Tax=Nematostella vectensis TaxID=45351 RepID=A7RLA1_NEMVE|nr:predicted protein [Nematostella vectensis]|eukprot:XP_001639958.1 predicted protein [Nematostella vectensis]